MAAFQSLWIQPQNGTALSKLSIIDRIMRSLLLAYLQFQRPTLPGCHCEETRGRKRGAEG